MEFSGSGFKSHSGQLSTSKNTSAVNTIYYIIPQKQDERDEQVATKALW